MMVVFLLSKRWYGSTHWDIHSINPCGISSFWNFGSKCGCNKWPLLHLSLPKGGRILFPYWLSRVLR
jgi:hypothetical protein